MEDTDELVGYCERCNHWTHFDKIDQENGCEECGGNFSSRHGYQITTERTFNPDTIRKRITKAESGA